MDIEEFDNKYKDLLFDREGPEDPLSRDIALVLKLQDELQELKLKSESAPLEDLFANLKEKKNLETKLQSAEEIIDGIKNKVSANNDATTKLPSECLGEVRLDANVGVRTTGTIIGGIRQDSDKNIVEKARKYVNDFKSTYDDAVDWHAKPISEPVYSGSQFVGFKKTIDRRTDLDKQTEELSKLFDKPKLPACSGTIDYPLPEGLELLNDIKEVLNKHGFVSQMSIKNTDK